MSEIKTIYLTQEGYEKLKEELAFLKREERPRITQAIADARAHGDLSENAEYDAAKDAQGLLEARIAKMESDVQSARIIDESQIDTSTARILSTVKVKNLSVKKEFTYVLVSPQEADFPAGRISVESPIGAALLGKSKGDTVDVNVPAGTIQLKILSIGRPS